MHKLIHARRRNLPTVFQGRSSRFYDFMSRRVVRRMYRRVAADIGQLAPAGAAVLDVGTGPGVLLLELGTLRTDLRLTGIDLSADMVTSARRNLAPLGDRATAQVADVTKLPFPDQSFDLVVSSLSLHHWDHPETAVPELARVLRPGGRVYIYDFPFAPFGTLTEAARSHAVLTGSTGQQPTPFRTGVPFLRCVRYTMS
jgi:ubiquinone/menaquinone biosynthesis C-methylase UbiE